MSSFLSSLRLRTIEDALKRPDAVSQEVLCSGECVLAIHRNGIVRDRLTLPLGLILSFPLSL